MTRYAEIVVNLPIRRTFSRQYQDDPPPTSEELPPLVPSLLLESADTQLVSRETLTSNRAVNIQSPPKTSTYRGLSTFHYHLPIELENQVECGHLVWVPFGHQQVQGIVIRLTDSAPVPTKPIGRLARAEPILTQHQLDLAAWIAEYYLSSYVEALKLFLPSGLLAKTPEIATRNRIRAKREIQIELLADRSTIEQKLPFLGRDSQQAKILTWFLENPNERPDVVTLRMVCGLKSTNALKILESKGLLQLQIQSVQQKKSNPTVSLTKSVAETQRALIEQRGADRYEPILQTLLAAGRPLWKSELYQYVQTNLESLRTLQKAGLIQLTEKIHFRDPLAGRTYPRTTPPPLTSDQAQVWQQIEEIGFTKKEATQFLLHGVTGSGKTEIYLRSIERTLALGRQTIVLVPEIALTPQTVARFAGRFPDRVTVIHSELNQGERYDVWQRIRDGEFDIVVGPRSALFAQMPRLGLIIVDEEHDASYKQDSEAWGSFTVFYDARTVARRLAQQTQSLLILGSATPSLDSYYAATQEQTKRPPLYLLNMPRRVLGHRITNQEEPTTYGSQAGQSQHQNALEHSTTSDETVYAELPPVELVDMRQELRVGNRSILSRTLQSELHATLDAGEQAILFLNRRGTRTFVMCRDCGHVKACPNCDIPLTWHERANVLVCHHCNQRAPIPTECPECQSNRIKYFGSGTQRIEDLVSQIAPRARLLRWDTDTTGRKGMHEQLLQQFANREADVLIGTQMIAKGLDLPMVTLVGVVSADTGLYLPDFRSGERTFQLLTQVAGRAGRSERGGRVVIQTYTPEHYAIQAAAQHDYEAFYLRESTFRREHQYPPILRMLRLVYWDKKLEKAQDATQAMADSLRKRLEISGFESEWTNIIGPAPAFFARFRNYYRWQILLRSPNPTAIFRDLTIPFGWRIDVDPVTML